MIFKRPWWLLLLLAGCTHHNPDVDFKPVYSVPEEWQPILDAFQQEAKLRGYTFAIQNLIIQYDETLVEPVCGQCNDARKDAPVQKIISISPRGCWTNDRELEALIFHELGHCFLGRSHVTARLPNGDPKSLMIPNDNTLYSPCNYDIGEPECDRFFKRNYYLDELFNADTPVPDWAKK